MTVRTSIIPHIGEGKFIVLGIDPGLSGALAFYYPSENIVTVYDMPRVQDEIDPHAMAGMIVKHSPTVAITERVGPMPRDGVRQAWRFSAANSVAKTVCALTNVPLSFVRPQDWKRELKLSKEKEQSRLMAIQKFPKSADQFSRVKDAGRAEAALIAYWSAQKFIYNRDRPE